MHNPAPVLASQIRYRRDIDGLRAVAVLPVLLFHAHSGWFGGGFVGVDIFFVISGFLITSLLLKDLERGTFSIARFYDRRARRILPALGFMVLAVTVAACLTYPPAELVEYGRRLFAASIFAANFQFWSMSGYFGPRAEDIELLHVWSLAVEEQFYVFFPLFLWAANRWFRPRALPWLIGGCALLSFALSVYAVAAYPDAAFYLLPTRAWELFLGSMLALRVLPAPSFRGAEAFSLGGLAMLLAAFFAYTNATPFPGLAAALPCLGAAFIIHAGQYHGETMVGRLLSTRAAVGVGLISYSLYLWHWPLLVMPGLYLGRDLTTAETAAALAAAFLLAYLSWRFVEAPFRRPDKRPPWRALVIAVAVIAAMAAAGLALVATRGLPERVPAGVVAIEDSVSSSVSERELAERGNCVPGEATRACPAGGIGVILWGDSHAEHHLAGISEVAKPLETRRWGMAGCPPLVDTSFLIVRDGKSVAPRDLRAAERCRTLNTEVLKAILARPDVRTVVLGGAWQFFTEGVEPGTGEGRFAALSPEGPFTAEASRNALRVGLTRTVDALRARDIRVVLMGDVPANSRAPAQCATRAIMFGRDAASCALPSGEALDRLRYSNALIAELAQRPGVYAFRPSDHLCRGERCRIMLGDGMVYSDSDHLTAAGAIWLAGFMDRAPFAVSDASAR